MNTKREVITKPHLLLNTTNEAYVKSREDRDIKCRNLLLTASLDKMGQY